MRIEIAAGADVWRLSQNNKSFSQVTLGEGFSGPAQFLPGAFCPAAIWFEIDGTPYAIRSLDNVIALS